MDNNKWTEEIKNNKELADGLEDCKIIDETTINQNLEYESTENKNILEKNEASKDIEPYMIDETGIQVLDEDDDEFLFLNKNKDEELNNDEKEYKKEIQNDELNMENKPPIQEYIDKEETDKKDKINIQNIWGKELGDFPVEKNKIEENNQNQEETAKIEVEEDIEPIKMPILQPEIAVDIENEDLDIVKPKDFSELVSKKGEILENYISGDAKFKSISENLGVCIELCKLFASVHSTGSCFNGLTANDIVITQNGQCKLISNEKIVSSNNEGYQINYEKTCAPEILRNESKPNINSDKHTMAFLLFGLMFKSNPFEGSKMLNSVIYTKEDELNFYKEPVFVYSYKENDKNNRPVYGVHSVLIKYWNRFYPESIKMIFKESFVEGINNPEARIEDTTVLEKLLNFKKLVDDKNSKTKPQINVKPESNPKSSLEKTRQKIRDGINYIKEPRKNEDGNTFEEKTNTIEINKDAAKKTIEEPKIGYLLRVDFSYTEGTNPDCIKLNLNPGEEIKNSVVGYYDISNEDIIGKVVQNAKHKNVIGLKNLSKYTWLATKGDREQKEFPPGKVIVISEGVKIDFYPENKSKTKSKWSIIRA